MTNHERHPAEPRDLGLAVSEWLLSQTPAGSTDQADIKLEHELLDQGVMNPDEAVELFDRLTPKSVLVLIGDHVITITTKGDLTCEMVGGEGS